MGVCFAVDAKGRLDMDIDRLEFLRNAVDAHNVKFLAIQDDCDEVIEFDEGLRRQLYINYDYGIMIQQIKKNCQKNKIYLICDAFGLRYITFQISMKNGDEKKYIVIGPYIEADDKPDALHVANEMGLELYQVQVLKDYYYEIAIVDNLDKVIHAMMRMIFSEVDWKIGITGMNLHEPEQGLQLRIQTEKRLSMEIVEARYRCENKALEAVAQGDVAKVELAMKELLKYRIEARSSDRLREAKNSLIIMNVLFRKAVEKAGVHPYYIDELSTSFAKRVEKASNTLETTNITREFAHKYCLLVKNYALKGYSDVIADCINYIEFNLAEDLTLNNLADQLNMNASSLSAKFKKEVGYTLTDYINQRRVNASLILLVTTNLPIGEVAEKVGYLNENYYSRIFKKIQGMTPREYRMSMIMGKEIN